MKVVKYQLAYMLQFEVDLCHNCVVDYQYPLGPVVQGRHEGYCESERCMSLNLSVVNKNNTVYESKK
jgi:hypothetical protein